MEKLALKYNLQEEYNTSNMEETVEVIEDNLEVEVGDEFQIFISFHDKNQDNIAEITNYICILLDSLNIDLKTSNAKNNREFIESRVEVILDSLSLLQTKTEKFLDKEGILNLQAQIEATITTAAEIKTIIMAKETELAIAKQTFKVENSKINQLELEIAELKKQYNTFYIDDKEILFPNLTKVPTLEIKYLKLQRELDYYSKVLEFLGPQFEFSKIEEAKSIPTFQILSKPARPEKKAKPRRSLIVLAVAFLTFMIITYYIYWQHYGKDMLHNYMTNSTNNDK
ncbi:MAG: hypothetical protein R3C26_13690 [Calditrichia bacterium]